MSTNNTQDALLKTRWLALALTLATFVLFAPAIFYDYIDYDDGIYVYDNKTVLKGLTFSGVGYAFTSIVGGSWMPLTWLSHMLDVTISDTSPMVPHAMNIVLHSLSAGILLLVLQRMTGRVWPSVFAAALFAFHPLRNESVVWVAERKDVLSTLLLMLGLFAYARYVEKPGWNRYVLVALCLVLGLMAKPMLVTFPFVLLLLDFWPLKRLGGDWPSLRQNLWPRVREKLPFFLIIILFCATTLWSQSHTGAVNRNDSSIFSRLCQVISNYAFYVQKIFYPAGLTILYPLGTTSPAHVLAFAIAFATATCFVVWRAFQQPWLLTGWFWFLGTLVPVAGIIHVGHISVADRYSYIPSVGLSLLLVWSAAEFMRAKTWARPFATSAGALAVVSCLIATRADLPRWKNSLILFQSAIKTAPHPVAYNNVGACYLDRHEYERAIEPFTCAIAMDTNYIKALVNRALAYQHTGRIAEAKADYTHLIKIEPRDTEGYNNRGDVLIDLGRLDDAISDFTSAIKLSPDSAHSYNNRGSVRLMKGDLNAAVQDCTKAIELNPRYANAYNTRGNAYNRMGDLPRALADYGKAIELSPADPLTYNNRAAIYFGLKEYNKSWADLLRCQELGGTPHAGLIQALNKAAPR